MKKYLIFFLLGIISFVGCKKDDPEENNDSAEQTVLVSGSVDAGEYSMEGMLVGTIFGEDTIVHSNFSVDVDTSNVLPQLVMVSNEKNEMVMLYRGIMNSKSNFIINEQTTTLALVTMHPLLAPSEGTDYVELCRLIREQPSYPTLYSEVRKSVSEGKNILDTTNVALFSALSNVLSELLSPITQTEKNLLFGCTVVDVTVSGNNVQLKTIGLAPSYFGSVTSPSGEQKEVNVLTRSDYALSDLIRNRTFNGKPTTVPMKEEGNYQFYLDCRNAKGWADFGFTITGEILRMFGLKGVTKAVLQPAIDNAVILLREGFFGKSVDLNTLAKNLIKQVGNWVKDHKKELKVNVNSLEGIEELLGTLSECKIAANLGLRIGFAFSAESPMEFNIWNDGHGNATSYDFKLLLESGDLQVGPPNGQLDDSLVVVLSPMNINNRYANRVWGRTVRFTVLDNRGTVSSRDVTTDFSGRAAVALTLGDLNVGDVCLCDAFVIDEETNYSISNTVRFVAHASNADVFSVSETTKVRFSPGNLQAIVDASGNILSWQFAEHQQDYIGNAAANNSIGTAAGVVDLFLWSTPLNTLGVGISSGRSSDFVDWGSNPIIKSTLGTGWRTLTHEEWSYLLGRTVNGGTGEGHSYQRITINGIYGLLLYPDNYTSQTTWTNEIPENCVFLPAAGTRKDNSLNILESDTNGYYWGASSWGYQSTWSIQSWSRMRCGMSGVDVGSFVISEHYNHTGMQAASVRLVKDYTYSANKKNKSARR